MYKEKNKEEKCVYGYLLMDKCSDSLQSECADVYFLNISFFFEYLFSAASFEGVCLLCFKSSS